MVPVFGSLCRMSLLIEDPLVRAAASSSTYAWLPFGAALILVLAARWLNLVWIGSYADYYREHYNNSIPTDDQLLAGAEWAVDVATAIPNCVLTLIGIILLDLPIAPQLIAVTCIVVVVLLFVAALVVARSQQLTEERRTLRNFYSPLDWIQITLNLSGLVVAIVLR
jgi:hypothetical protein